MSHSPNIFYYFFLFSWPFFAIWIFNKYRLDKAVILLFLVPYLFLPVASSDHVIKLPLLPSLDKEAIPVLAVIWLLYRKKIKIDYLPRAGISRVFCLAFCLAPFLTVFSNMEPIDLPGRSIPGLRLSEAFSIFVAFFLKMYIPFVVGYSLLGTDKSHEEFVLVIFVLGLFYSVLMLYEVRMSPQLHRYVYGFFPHDWRQQLRAGGFRPVVFLGHGLLVALFGCVSAIAAYAMWRSKHQLVQNKGAILFLYLCIVLIFCKTYSALIYLTLFLALSVFTRISMRLKCAAVIALIVLSFPVIRGWLPLADVTEFFAGLNPERAGSLQFRFNNEDALLDRASEKPYFGWGTWGRNRVYDPLTGRDLSVTDGAWIIIFGGFGWLGYIGLIGLLCYPVIALARAVNPVTEKEISPYSAALVLMLVIFLIDQIPNASLNHITYLMAGALLGRAQEIRSTA